MNPADYSGEIVCVELWELGELQGVHVERADPRVRFTAAAMRYLRDGSWCGVAVFDGEVLRVVARNGSWVWRVVGEDPASGDLFMAWPD